MAREPRRTARRAAGAAALLSTVALGGCTDIENAMAALPFLNYMHEAPFFDPYEAPRPAPPNAVPVESPAGEWEPTIATPVTEAALQAFAAQVRNPVPLDAAVVTRGQEIFTIYCAVCHGPVGRGNGPVVGPGKFPMGPDLTIPTTVARSDGYIYAVVKAGRGLMPSYRRIPPRDRWAVVHYIREIQRGGADTAPAAGAPAVDTARPAAGQPAPGGATPPTNPQTGGQE